MINLLDFDREGLAALCQQLGAKPYRATQLMRWIHQRGEADFARMSDLSKDFRERLQGEAIIAPPRMTGEQAAPDGTRKWLLAVDGGNAIEAVFIPEVSRGTLCVSSQVGCALECTFCATGRQGFNRNLKTAEIIGQLWWAKKALGNPPALGATPLDKGDTARTVTNVVFMGMGEPLLNFDNVVTALKIMLDDYGYGLSRRRVTLSTSGVVPYIDRLGEACPVALAVSLHAPNDALRDVLVPINRKYPLEELLAACRRYIERAPRDFVTFEYVMLDGVNDSVSQAKELVRLTHELPCKFNLIPFNQFADSGYRRSSDAAIERFASTLSDAGVVTTVRKTRGFEVAAACGQLAGKVEDRTRRVVRRLTRATA